MGTILLMGAGLQATVTGSTYDPDAQLFFNAQSGAGVTLTTTQKDAINQWVIDSKAVGVWSKMKAIYPMVGGTATSHKFNLKNPLDTNAAYRLIFNGGWTHSTNGALPNGTNGYASTFLIPNTVFGGGYASVGFYVNQASTISGRPIGSTNMDIILGSGFVRGGNKASTSSTASLQSPNDGFVVNSRIVSSNFFVMNRDRVFSTPPTPVLAVPTYATASDIALGATNQNGTIVSYSDGRIAFAYCSDGLTQNECLLLYQITEKYQVALSRSVYPAQPFYYNAAYNNETNLFLFNTQITDNTIQTATDTLVTDLKTAGVFTKMKALYPMVGGTATTHKFNLVNAQDTDAAFRLAFVGGGTHSSNGYLPNGVNAYANTFLTPTTSLTNNNTHVSFYSRTNSAGLYFDFGSGQAGGQYFNLALNISGIIYSDQYNNSTGRITTANANTQGFYISSRTLSNVFKLFKNSAQIGTTNTGASTGFTSLSGSLVLSALRESASIVYFSNRECAFASIGDGLTDLESQLLYQITEKYQVALSRNVNALQSFYYNSAYNNETNAFLFSTQITDNTIQTATDTLVSDLKAASIWAKMKVIYPMVGGTAFTHSRNLVTSNIFSLGFNGGWTHDSLGAKPNGINGFATTGLTTPNTQFSVGSVHQSYYNVTNSSGGGAFPTGKTEIGSGSTNTVMALGVGTDVNKSAGGSCGGFVGASANLGSGADVRGFVNVSRTSTTLLKAYKNGVVLGSNTAAVSNLPFTMDLNIGCNYFSDGASTRNQYSDRQGAFISFGSGLTDAEALAFYNAVQTFQTTLGRQV